MASACVGRRDSGEHAAMQEDDKLQYLQRCKQQQQLDVLSAAQVEAPPNSSEKRALGHSEAI